MLHQSTPTLSPVSTVPLATGANTLQSLFFRISATSTKLNGYILLVQIIFSPPIVRLIYTAYHHKKQVIIYTLNTVMSVMRIWNLDIFHLVYSPFCLHPDTNTLQVMAFDYLIAVYSLLLIGLSYLLVLLYDENVRLYLQTFVALFMRQTMEHQELTSGCLGYFPPPLLCQDS